MAKNKLKNLMITEISHVDSPANDGARVQFFKRRDDLPLNQDVLKNKDDDMTAEDLKKAQDEAAAAQAKLAEVEKSNKELTAKVEELTKAATEASKATEDASKSEDLYKGLPDEVKKQIQDGQAAAQQVELMKMAKRAQSEYPNIIGTDDEKGALLKSLEALPEKEREYAHKLLKSTEEMAKSTLGTTGSSSASNATEPDEQLAALAKELQKKESGLTYEQAYAKVLSTPEGVELYKSR